jgi:hypothetical protein
VARRVFREVSIHMGAFDYEITVIVGPQAGVEDYIRQYHKNPEFIDEFSGSASAVCYHLEHDDVVIWLPRVPRNSQQIGVLAHEAVHAAWHMLRWANVPLNDDTEEVFSHAVGRIVNTTLEKLRERK